MSKLPPCSEKPLFYIVPLNEAAVPACRAHTGDIMENLILRGCQQNGWAYVPYQNGVDMGPCHGKDGGKTAQVAAPAILPASALPPSPKKRARA